MSGPIRSALGPKLKRLKDLLDNVRPILNLENITPVQRETLKLKRDSLEKLLESVNEKEQQWVLFIHGLDIENQPDEEAKYDEFKYENKSLNEWIENGKEVLELVEQNTIDDDAPQAHGMLNPIRPRNGNNRNGANQNNDSMVSVHLPKLTLPEFKGDPHQWPSFWESFDAAVNSQNLDPIIKLNFLHNCLKGEALEAIADIHISGPNYPIVVGILKNKFGDKKVLAEALESKLIKLSPATDGPLSVKKTVENIERICRQLRALNHNVENSYLTTSIKSKMPRNVLLELAKEEEAQGRNWNTTELREALVRFVTIRDKVYTTTQHFRIEQKEGNSKESKKGNFTRSFAIIGSENTQKEKLSSNSNRKVNCLFCNGDHMASKCEAITDVRQRMGLLAEQERCFKCLKRGHKSPSCQTEIKCQICSGAHNGVICFKREHKEQNAPKISETGQKIEFRTNFNKGARNPGTKANATPLGKRNKNWQPGKPKGNGSYAAILEEQDELEGSDPENDNEPEVEKTSNHLNIHNIPKREAVDTILMAQRVPIFSPRNPQRTVNALVFFDPGSQNSYITNKLIRKLSPPKIAEGFLEVNGFRADQPVRFKSGKYIIGFKERNGTHKQLILYSTERFTKGFKAAILGNVSNSPSFEEVKGNVLFINEEPDILLGVVEYCKFITSAPIELITEFYLFETTVGPIVCGINNLEKFNGNWSSHSHMTLGTFEENAELNTKEIAKWWDLESVGITESPNEDENESAIILFEKSIRQVNGRYRMKWPWKDQVNLPSNYSLAYRCLESILKRLHGMSNPDLLEKYDNTIKDQLTRGIIEETTRNINSLEHYLPHHPVITHKLRLVYNASAKMRNGKSLNECLYKGPSLLPELVGLLMRFRLPKYCLLADIEKAFLMLELETPDRDVTKFLWLRDPKKPLTKENLIIYRFQRVAFGVISSPFLLCATINHHLKKYPDSALAKQLIGNIYMDNLFMSCDSEDQVIEMYHESKQIFLEAQMNLREYTTNCIKILSEIPKEDTLDTMKPKILGINWNLEKDSLEIRFPSDKSETEEVPTRRTVLQKLASFFDPLGLCSPCVVPGKIFFQKLWDLSKSWDDFLPEKEILEWKKIQQIWSSGSQMDISRRVIFDNETEKHLHTFVDASNSVYAATVYLYSKGPNGTQIELIFAKNRLKPKAGNITIPRMELMALLIGIRAQNIVEREIKTAIKSKNIWSDSKAVLSWLKQDNEETKPRFVANRLKEIRKASNCTFRFVRSNDNPADIATRGASPEELRICDLWWHGPKWLKEENWSSDLEVRINDSIEISEQDWINSTVSMMGTSKWIEGTNILENLLNIGNHSKWEKLVNATTIVLKFLRIKFTKYFDRFPEKGTKLRREIMLIEPTNDASYMSIGLAEKLLIKLAQISQGTDFGKWLIHKNAEDGIIRLKTRLIRTEGNPELECPIILPKGSPILKLLIMHLHEHQKHMGAEQTLTSFLCYFWTPQARRTVKKVIGNCGHCKVMKAYPFALPPMANLPSDRTQRRSPFEVIGIDYLGPSAYKENGINNKVWIVLITCLCTRGVYLEPVKNLSAKSFLLVLRRFIARRGCPKKVLSDNGTQFKLAAKAIEQTIRPTSTEFEWKFANELSSWQSGVWERLVGICKSGFKRTLGRNILDFDEFNTFVAEIEAIMNQRPLTYVNENPQGTDEFYLPLRPVDFFQPKATLDMQCDTTMDEYPNTTMGKLISSWHSTLTVLDSYWDKWKKDYLILLRERSKWHIQGPKLQTHRDPIIGEVVIVEDESKPRNLWSYGKIIEIIGTGKPGAIRNVKLLMPNKRILSRPINKIYPLEVREEIEPIDKETKKNKDTTERETMRDKNPKSQRAKNEISPMVLRSHRKTLPQTLKISTNMMLFILGLILFSQTRVSGKNYKIANTKCIDCTADCSLRGIHIKSTENCDKIEICCENSICSTHPQISEWNFELKPENLLKYYSCTTNFWKNAQIIKTVYSRCGPVSVCTLIQCYFCIDRIINPDCTPLFSTFLIGILTLWVFLILFIFFWLIQCLLFKLAWIRMLCLIPKWFARRNRKRHNISHSEDEEELLPKRRAIRTAKWNARKNAVTLSLIIIGLTKIEMVLSGSEVISISASSEECFRTQNEISCLINSVNTITLLPAGQDINLLVKDNKGNNLGNLKLMMKSLEIHCLPRTEMWTRSYMVDTITVKRCPRMGSCLNDYCRKVYPSTPVPELKNWAKFPGHNHCGETCSFWWCGCGLPSPACLFYRNIANPTSETVFEVFSCSEWEYRIRTEIELTYGGNTSVQKILLYPGMTWNNNNISLTPLSVSLPPSPILHKKFLTDGKSVALIDSLETDLECKTEEEAKNFSCTLGITSCAQCQPDHYQNKEVCQCRNVNLEEKFTNPELTLPLESPKLYLKNQGKGVFSESQYSPIQIMIKFQGLKLNMLSDLSACNIEIHTFEGCYRCIEGAELNLTCFSDFGFALAEINCNDDTTFMAKCSENGTHQTTALSFENADINLSCYVDCPGGKNKLSLKGHLKHLSTDLKTKFTLSQIINTTDIQSQFQWWFWDFDFKKLLQFSFEWEHLIVLLLVIIIGIFILFLFIKCNPTFHLYRKIGQKILTITFLLFLASGGTLNCNSMRNDSFPSLFIRERNPHFTFIPHPSEKNLNLPFILSNSKEILPDMKPRKGKPLEILPPIPSEEYHAAEKVDVELLEVIWYLVQDFVQLETFEGSMTRQSVTLETVFLKYPNLWNWSLNCITTMLVNNGTKMKTIRGAREMNFLQWTSKPAYQQSSKVNPPDYPLRRPGLPCIIERNGNMIALEEVSLCFLNPGIDIIRLQDFKIFQTKEMRERTIKSAPAVVPTSTNQMGNVIKKLSDIKFEGEKFKMPLIEVMWRLVAEFVKNSRHNLEEVFEKDKQLWGDAINWIKEMLQKKMTVMETNGFVREVDFWEFTAKPASKQITIPPNTTFESERKHFGKPLQHPNLPCIREHDGNTLAFEMLTLVFDDLPFFDFLIYHFKIFLEGNRKPATSSISYSKPSLVSSSSQNFDLPLLIPPFLSNEQPKKETQIEESKMEGKEFVHRKEFVFKRSVATQTEFSMRDVSQVKILGVMLLIGMLANGEALNTSGKVKIHLLANHFHLPKQNLENISICCPISLNFPLEMPKRRHGKSPSTSVSRSESASKSRGGSVSLAPTEESRSRSRSVISKTESENSIYSDDRKTTRRRKRSSSSSRSSTPARYKSRHSRKSRRVGNESRKSDKKHKRKERKAREHALETLIAKQSKQIEELKRQQVSVEEGLKLFENNKDTLKKLEGYMADKKGLRDKLIEERLRALREAAQHLLIKDVGIVKHVGSAIMKEGDEILALQDIGLPTKTEKDKSTSSTSKGHKGIEKEKGSIPPQAEMKKEKETVHSNPKDKKEQEEPVQNDKVQQTMPSGPKDTPTQQTQQSTYRPPKGMSPIKSIYPPSIPTLSIIDEVQSRGGAFKVAREIGIRTEEIDPNAENKYREWYALRALRRLANEAFNTSVYGEQCLNKRFDFWTEMRKLGETYNEAIEYGKKSDADKGYDHGKVTSNPGTSTKSS